MDKTAKDTKKDGPLTGSEKVQVLLLLIFNTIISWVIFHFGWKEKLPIKAKQVDSYIKIFLGILIGIAVLGIIFAVAMIGLAAK